MSTAKTNTSPTPRGGGYKSRVAEAKIRLVEKGRVKEALQMDDKLASLMRGLRDGENPDEVTKVRLRYPNSGKGGRGGEKKSDYDYSSVVAGARPTVAL